MNELMIDSEQKIRIELFAEILSNNGFQDVRACAGNFQRPKSVFLEEGEIEYTPDITATKKRFCIFKVETPMSILERETQYLWLNLSDFATKNNMSLGIIVPQYSMAAANQKLEEFSIQARILEM